MRRPLLVLPVLVFLLIAGIFYYQLQYGRPAEELPSVMIGKKVPALSLPGLDGTAAVLTSDDFGKGRAVVVNVFASWCPPCRLEHETLTRLSAIPGVTLYGITYKDKPEDTMNYLAQLGNPFDKIAVDRAGRSLIDWGVYGAPETFVISADGTILFRYAGELTDEMVETEIVPRLK